MVIQENCFLQIELTLVEIILVPYLVYSFSFHSKYSFAVVCMRSTLRVELGQNNVFSIYLDLNY